MKTKEKISQLKKLLSNLQKDNVQFIIMRLINYSGKLLPFFHPARPPFQFSGKSPFWRIVFSRKILPLKKIRQTFYPE